MHILVHCIAPPTFRTVECNRLILLKPDKYMISASAIHA